LINLLYAGNDYTYDGILMSLLSIVKHCKKNLNVYILTMDLSEINKNYVCFSTKHKEILENEIKKVNKKSKVNLIDVKKLYVENLLNGKNQESKYTPYSMIRLLSDKIEKIPDKILYLDYDVLAYDNIENLYNINIDDYEFAGVKDYYGKILINRNYINSGVLLLNIKKIRETGLFSKCLKVLKTKKMLLPDQSALNFMASKKLIIPREFNEQNKLHNNTILRHFSMTIKFFPKFKKQNIKPWNIDNLHNKLKTYEFDDIIEKYLKIKNKGENYEQIK